MKHLVLFLLLLGTADAAECFNLAMSRFSIVSKINEHDYDMALANQTCYSNPYDGAGCEEAESTPAILKTQKTVFKSTGSLLQLLQNPKISKNHSLWVKLPATKTTVKFKDGFDHTVNVYTESPECEAKCQPYVTKDRMPAALEKACGFLGD